jgi:methylenetetrahydrofolate reductase (NADPH)
VSPLTAANAAAPEGAAASRQLVRGFSIEATPRQLAAAGPLTDLLPPGTEIYVPYLPRSAPGETVRACRQLTAEGFRPVPHVSARAMVTRAKLDLHLARLAEAGASMLLLIAGDRRRPAGPFRSTLDVLETGLLRAHGFNGVGVAGHPEGHPAADEPTLMRALHAKSAYARDTGSTLWVVTQFTFSAAPVIAWLHRIRSEGIDLPVRIGLPGPARPQTLLRYALQCGVGASSRMLTRRPDAVTRLLGRWTPDTMLPSLADHRAASAASTIAGIHVFPFGGLLKSIDFFTKL